MFLIIIYLLIFSQPPSTPNNQISQDFATWQE